MSSAKRVVLLGAVLIGVGSLMPWGKVDTAFGSLTINGTQGDGMITIVLGGILLLISLMRQAKPGRMYSLGALILAIIALLVSGAAMLRIGGLAAESASEYARTSVGTGVFIVIVGSIIAAIGASKVVPEEPTDSAQPVSGVIEELAE